MPKLYCFQCLKCEDLLLSSVLCQSKLNIFGFRAVGQTINLQTSHLALGNCDCVFSFHF